MSFSVCVINARSIRNKRCELIEFIKLHEVDIILLNETWLDGKETVNIMDEFKTMHSISSCWFSRENKHGGGTAILCSDGSNIRLLKKEEAFSKYQIEICSALVLIRNQKCVVISIYSPPNYNSRQKCNEVVVQYVLKIKTKYPSAQVILGGDFNRAKLHIQDHLPFMSKSILLETRGKASLDHIYLHQIFEIQDSFTLEPLQSDDQTSTSDHRIVFTEVTLKVNQYVTQPETNFRKIVTKRGWQTIGEALDRVPWNEVLVGDPNVDAKRLKYSLDTIVDLNSKPVREKRKESIKPWFNDTIRLIDAKIRMYKKHRFGPQYKRVKKKLTKEIQQAKTHFYNNKIKKLKKTDPRAFFATIRDIVDPDKVDLFDPVQATSSDNSKEAADKIAKHFADISGGFRPLTKSPKNSLRGSD